jgi:hypothetical protein
VNDSAASTVRTEVGDNQGGGAPNFELGGV